MPAPHSIRPLLYSALCLQSLCTCVRLRLWRVPALIQGHWSLQPRCQHFQRTRHSRPLNAQRLSLPLSSEAARRSRLSSSGFWLCKNTPLERHKPLSTEPALTGCAAHPAAADELGVCCLSGAPAASPVTNLTALAAPTCINFLRRPSRREVTETEAGDASWAP